MKKIPRVVLCTQWAQNGTRNGSEGEGGALVHAHTAVSPTQGGDCCVEGRAWALQIRQGWPEMESCSCPARPSVTAAPLSGGRPCPQQLGRAACAPEGRAQAFIRAGFPTGTWPWWWFCLWPRAPPPHLEHFAYLSRVPTPVPAAALPGVLAACLCRCSWEGRDRWHSAPRSSPSERRWEAAGASRGGKQGAMSTGGGAWPRRRARPAESLELLSVVFML